MKISNDLTHLENILTEEVGFNGEANIFIAGKKTKAAEEFAMIFTANFDLLLQNKRFSMQDIKVLFKILSKMAFGNHLAIKQKAIAEEMQINKSNVSKTWRKFLECGIIVQDQFGNEFINYDLFLKGNASKDSDFARKVECSHEALEKAGIKTNKTFAIQSKAVRDQIEKMKASEEQRQMASVDGVM